MAGFVIEPLQDRDAGAARDLILRGLVERLGPLDPRRNPDLDDVCAAYAAGCFLVARSGGAILGTGAYLPTAPRELRIHRMSTAREHRRRGVGTVILAALLAHGRTRGFRRAVVETTETWNDAIAFYERRGFREVAREPGEVFLARAL